MGALLLAALLAAFPTWAGEAAKAAPQAGAEERARSYFTDLELVTHEGRRVRFYSDVLKGRVVLINFVYTHCSDACPLITRTLGEVKDRLEASGAGKVTFVSISIDPERDPPEALKAFARQHNANRADWIFLTGAKKNVEHIVRKLGQYTERAQEHSTLLIAGNDRTRHWMKIPPGQPVSAIAERLRLLAAEG